MMIEPDQWEAREPIRPTGPMREGLHKRGRRGRGLAHLARRCFSRCRVGAAPDGDSGEWSGNSVGRDRRKVGPTKVNRVLGNLS